MPQNGKQNCEKMVKAKNYFLLLQKHGRIHSSKKNSLCIIFYVKLKNNGIFLDYVLIFWNFGESTMLLKMLGCI